MEAGKVNLEDTNIVFPKEIYQEIDDLTKKQNETTGVMLARKEYKDGRMFYYPEYFKVFTEGEATKVDPPLDHIHATNALSKKHPDLKVIQRHTHAQ